MWRTFLNKSAGAVATDLVSKAWETRLIYQQVFFRTGTITIVNHVWFCSMIQLTLMQFRYQPAFEQGATKRMGRSCSSSRMPGVYSD